MKNKISIFLMLIISATLITNCNISAGSNTNAETYNFEINESELIQKINLYKKINTDLNPPISLRLKDGRDNEADLWYSFYFYYKDKNQIVLALLRGHSEVQTTVYLISVNNGMKLGNWKLINKDFSDLENANQKTLFEDRILKKLDVSYKKKSFWDFD